jgi:hypothetical protein
MLCGISFGFPELFPIGGQIAHVLRTRAPCAIPYCYGTRTRLACVKHAASVRSEPGSNSRLKPVAWAKKNAPVCTEASLPKQIIDRSNYSIHPRSKTRMVSNRFWHIVSVVKERTPLSSRKALPQPNKYLRYWRDCQQQFRRPISRFPQGSQGSRPRRFLDCHRHSDRKSALDFPEQ